MDWKQTLEIDGLPESGDYSFKIQDGGLQSVKVNGKAVRVSKRFRAEASKLLKPSGFMPINYRTYYTDCTYTMKFHNGMPEVKEEPLTKYPSTWQDPILKGVNREARAQHKLNLKHYIRHLVAV